MNSIRFVPTWLHDYIGGIGLIAAPLFWIHDVGGIAVILPMVLGVGLILYSLLTDYERGIPALKFIPMPVHLVLDFAASALLAASPFMFGFWKLAPNVWLPHVIARVGVIVPSCYLPMLETGVLTSGDPRRMLLEQGR